LISIIAIELNLHGGFLVSDSRQTTVAPDFDVRRARLSGPGGPFEFEAMGGDGAAGAFKAKPHTLVELFLGLGRLGEREVLTAGAVRLTYVGFLRRAKWGALGLTRLGVRPGDRVGIAMDGGVNWLVAFAAIILSGATVVMLLPGSNLPDGAGAANCVLVLSDVGAWAAACEGEGEPEPWSAPPGAPGAEAIIAFTSGTTGPPKLVLIDHRGIVSGLRNMMLGGALAALRRPRSAAGPGAARPAAPCVLLMAPLHHVAGYGQFLLMLLLGGRIVLPAERSAAAVIDLVKAEKVGSIVGMLPELILDIIETPMASRDMGSLGSVTFYGARAPAALAARLRRAMPDIEVGAGYGMTETNGSIAVASQHDLADRPDTAGHVSPVARIRILDEGREAEPGAIGEVWVSGPFLAKGYVGPHTGRSTAFHDGWLKTGDRGRMDSEGFLFLAEREREPIHLGARQIPYAALEQAAFRCETVRDAAAFCLDRAGAGEAAALALVLQPGADWTGLRRRLADELGVGPLRLVQVASIPRTTSGKIDRRRLQQDLDLREDDYSAAP
jgi:acyl-CoA synthetase (AMP-forming)/AMP-acid ligase II